MSNNATHPNIERMSMYDRKPRDTAHNPFLFLRRRSIHPSTFPIHLRGWNLLGSSPMNLSMSNARTIMIMASPERHDIT